ncbi:hypothetical protein HY641_04835 [Candidatus Woesearchaeota archaeon]|nr:hypothetical protein [Candidatus Woesearchaeota archaeon]
MILIRYDEIWLKGQNQIHFLHALRKSIQHFFVKKGHPKPPITTPHGRLIVETDLEPYWVKNIFGISSYSFATRVPLDLETIKETSLALYSRCGIGPFRVTCQRLDKRFPHTSQEIEKTIGAQIVQTMRHDVNLTHYTTELSVELINGWAYIFIGRIQGHGGYPVGTQGKALLLVDTTDDLLAGILMMKRGCNLLVHNPLKKDLGQLARYHATEPGILPELSDEAITRYNLLACVNTSGTGFGGLVRLNPLAGFTLEELEGLRATFLSESF